MFLYFLKLANDLDPQLKAYPDPKHASRIYSIKENQKAVDRKKE